MAWMNLPLALLIFLFWGVVLGSSSAPAAIDWRNNNGTNYVTSVKNQGGLPCDNSWAFAAVSVVESALLIKNSSTEGGLDLSEQQVLDCGSYPRDRNGCHNGTVDDALRFITTRGGLSRELDYPLYTGLNTGICRQPRGSMVSTQGLASYLAVDGNDEDQLAQALATHGPVAVTISHGPSLNSYRAGIFNDVTCGMDSDDRTTSMTLVGYGTDQDGKPYWTLKNSWGRKWGEGGFLKLARDFNLCGIVTHPSYFLA